MNLLVENIYWSRFGLVDIVMWLLIAFVIYASYVGLMMALRNGVSGPKWYVWLHNTIIFSWKGPVLLAVIILLLSIFQKRY